MTFNKRVSRAMNSIVQGNKDGALICETADMKRLVFFEQGHIVGAKSNDPNQRLGAILVKEKRITGEQVKKATNYIRSGMKLGQILVELGYLQGGEIEGFVRIQIIEIARSMLMSSPTRLVFTDRVPVQALTLSPVSVADVFMDAARKLGTVQYYRENVLTEEFVLARVADPVLRSQRLHLTPDEAFVLEQVSAGGTANDIIKLSPMEDEDTLRILVGLLQSGMIELREKPRPKKRGRSVADNAVHTSDFEQELSRVYSQIQCQNHWEVLGLVRGASQEQIKTAYDRVASQFELRHYEHIADSEFQEKLSFVFTRLTEAFRTLTTGSAAKSYHKLVEREQQYEEKKAGWESVTDGAKATEAGEPDRRNEPNESDGPEPEPSEPENEVKKDPEAAKRFFEQAKRSYREGDHWRAIELCRTAVELADDNEPGYFHLLGRALSENPRWRKDAEKNLKIAINLKPWEPRYLVSLAQLYEKEGLQQRAQRTYEQVKVMDPDYRIPDLSDSSKEGEGKGASRKKAG